jgi:hypothetical protein
MARRCFSATLRLLESAARPNRAAAARAAGGIIPCAVFGTIWMQHTSSSAPSISTPCSESQPRLLRVLLCRLLGIAESDELQAVANAGIDTRSQIHLVYDLRLISDI